MADDGTLKYSIELDGQQPIKELSSIEASLQKAEDQLKKLVIPDFGSAANELKEVEGAVAALGTTALKVSEQINSAAKAQEAFQAALQKAEDNLKKLEVPSFEKTTNELKEVEGATSAVGATAQKASNEIKSAAKAQEAFGHHTDNSLNGLKRMVEVSDQTFAALSSGFGLTKVLNERASVSMAVLGAGMGGVGGVAVMIAPLVAEVGLQLWKLATEGDAAEKQLEATKAAMESLTGVLEAMNASLEKASKQSLEGFFKVLGQDSKSSDQAVERLRRYADAMGAVDKAQQAAAMSRLDSEKSAKLAGVSGRDDDLQKQRIELEYEEKKAKVRSEYASKAADDAVRNAKMEDSEAARKVQFNASEQETLEHRIAKAEEAKRTAIAAAANGGTVSDQQYQLDRMQELRNKSRSLGDQHKQLSDPERAELNGLLSISKSLKDQVRKGDVTFGDAKVQRKDVAEQVAAAKVGGVIANADAEIKASKERLKQAHDAAADLEQKRRSAADGVKVAEANRIASSEASRATEEDLKRRRHELGRATDQRKGQHEEADRRSKQDAANKASEDKAAKQKEGVQEFVQRFGEFAQVQHERAVGAAQKQMAGIKGYDPARAAREAQALALAKAASPEALRAVAHKFFTPDLLKLAQTPTTQGRFVKEQIDHVQKIIQSTALHGQQIAHDLGKDKQGNKVVSRVWNKNAKTQKDPVEEATREMADRVAKLHDLLAAKITVF